MKGFSYMKAEAYDYIQHIRSKLWQGRASILVGAGFSRNADKMPGTTNEYPLWSDLNKPFVEALSIQWYNELHQKLSSGKKTETEFQSEIKSLNTMELAEEIEKNYGRSELDRIMRDSIHIDGRYKPSKMHQGLLQLPWRDVFTTNYDTFLEQAAQTYSSVAKRGYVVVTCQEELVGTGTYPRIVKLHGSFPSTRPFIITQTDYDNYPHNFPAFVNTVQQSIIENTLCLIGFSGNDPNFHAWAKWIKNSLGTYAPVMYLITNATMPAYEIRKFRELNTIVVDISTVCEGDTISKLYEDFIKKLGMNEKEDSTIWPLRVFPLGHTIGECGIDELLSKLAINRNEYPGWLIVPRRNRGFLNRIRENIERLLTCYTPSTNTEQETFNETTRKLYNVQLGMYDASKALQLISEYDWLREKCLCPPFDNELNVYKSALAQCKDDENLSSDIKRLALRIMISLMRDCREAGQYAEWEEYHSQFNELAHLASRDDLHCLHHEKCLYLLFTLDYFELENELLNWDVEHYEHRWILYKSGLLSEVNRLSDAETLLSESLKDLRRQLQYDNINLLLLSLESAMMSLIRSISHILKSHYEYVERKKIKAVTASQHILGETNTTLLPPKETTEGEQEKDSPIDATHEKNQMQLHKRLGVSWEDENDAFAVRLSATFVPSYKTTVKNASFDFGWETTTEHHGETETWRDIRSAISFFRFREETGHPLKISNYVIGSFNTTKDAAAGAAIRVSFYTLEWSLIMLARTGNHKALSDVLTRPHMSEMSVEAVDKIMDIYTNALEKLSDLKKGTLIGSFIENSAYVIPDLLSRLCSKSSLARIDMLLDVLYKIYCVGEHGIYYGHNSIRTLMRRLMASLSHNEKLARMSKLLSFPHIKLRSDEYTDPIRFIPVMLGHKQNGCFAINETQGVSELLLAEKDEDMMFSIGRLLVLSNIGLLTKPQNEAFLSLLKKNSYSLPNWMLPIALLGIATGTDDTLAFTLRNHIRNFIEGGLRTTSYNASNAMSDNIFDMFEGAAQRGVFTADDLDNIIRLCIVQIEKCEKFYNQNQKFDIFGEIKNIKRKLREICAGLYHLILLHPEWTPTADVIKKMNGITAQTISGKDELVYAPFLSFVWMKKRGQPIDQTFLIEALLSNSKDKHIGILDTLNLSFFYPENYVVDTGIRMDCIKILCQQMIWRTDSLVSSAVQIVNNALTVAEITLTDELLQYISIGLLKLYDETKITFEDTLKLANDKGAIRKATFRLAITMSNIYKNENRPLPESLPKWLGIFDNVNEFAEVRNAGHSNYDN